MVGGRDARLAFLFILPCVLTLFAAAGEEPSGTGNDPIDPGVEDDSTALLQATSPSRRSGNRPNLLFIFPDQLRWDWVGFDEPALRTPTLKRLAEAGTRFTKAYTPSPLCETSRGALASGRDYATSPLQDPTSHYPVEDETSPTFYSLLKDSGYHTMLAGKDHLRGNGGLITPGAVPASALGFSDAVGTLDKYLNTARKKPVEAYGAEIASANLSDGGDAYLLQKECYGAVGFGGCCDEVLIGLAGKVDVNKFLGAGYSCPRMSPLPDELYPDNWVEAVGERLLERRPEGQPWFMQLGFLGPHPPFILTPAMNASVKGRDYPGPVGNQAFPEDVRGTMRAAYAAMVENIDAQVGRLLSYLQEKGELDNTVVVFTADHGEMLGDFNLLEKSVPWEGSAHVPLIVSGPGMQKGAIVEAPVSTVDVVGSFLELAGAKKDKGMTAGSLLEVLQQGTQKSLRSSVLSGLDYPNNNYDWHMVVEFVASQKRTMKLICCPTGCPTSLGNRLAYYGQPSLLLQEVTGKPTAEELTANELYALADVAAEMFPLLPSRYQEACRHLLPAS